MMPQPGDALTRPDILALPSATACRAIGLLFALLSAGLYAGGSLFHSLPIGDRWFRRVSDCSQQFPSPTPTDVPAFIATGTKFQQCADSVNTGLVLFQVMGALVAVIGCAALTLAAPAVLRRRRRLRPAGSALSACVARVAQLSYEAGLPRPPLVLIGQSSQRDAFGLGVPGRYAVALPPALAIRSNNSQLFDPVLRHELQHIHRHDVPLAWSARSAGWLLLPLLILPVGHEIATTDFSVLPAYAWRAALLALTAVLASAAILRSREREADIGSAHTPDQRAALTAVLAAQPASRAPGWRAALALHPSRAARLQTIADPAVGTRVAFADGFTIALLASLTMPMITSLLSDKRSLSRWVSIGSPAIVGTLFGITLGLALWREELARRASGRQGAPALPVLAGVFAGFLLGQTSALAKVATAGLGGLSLRWSDLVSPVAAVAVTAMCLATAPLFADAVPRLTRRTAAAACVALSATLFATTMWIAGIIEPSLDAGGWPLIRSELVVIFATRGFAVASAGLVVMILFLLVRARGRSLAPDWAFDGPHAAQWPLARLRPGLAVTMSCAVAAGAAGGLVIVIYRGFAGPAADDLHLVQRAYVDYWILALSGTACVLALAARYGRRGLAAGIAGSPIAIGVAAAIFAVLNAVLGSPNPVAVFTEALRRGLGLGGVQIIIAALALMLVELGSTAGQRIHIDQSRVPARTNPAWLVVLGAGVLTLLFTSGALLGRETLSPLAAVASDLSQDASFSGPPASSAQEVQMYRNQFAPTALDTLRRIDNIRLAINNDQTLSDAQRATKIRSTLLSPTRQLLTTASTMSLSVPAVHDSNQHLIKTLTLQTAEYEDAALAFETGNQALLTAAGHEGDLARTEFGVWLNAVAALH